MKLNLKSRKIALPAMPKRESHPEVASLPYNTPSPDKPRERDLTHLIKDSAVKLESVCKRVKQTYEGLEETPPEPLEARDRRVIVPYEFKRKSFVLSNEKNDLNIWIGEMHFKVVSVSFNFLVSHQLTYE